MKLFDINLWISNCLVANQKGLYELVYHTHVHTPSYHAITVIRPRITDTEEEGDDYWVRRHTICLTVRSRDRLNTFSTRSTHVAMSESELSFPQPCRHSSSTSYCELEVKCIYVLLTHE